MKRVYLLGLLLLFSCLSGCKDNTNLEDISPALLLGIDLDEENHLIISSSSPVFSKEAEKKDEANTVRARSFRQSSDKFDVTVIAVTKRGKVQVLLIGKRIMQHPDWFKLLDALYRDGKNTTKSRVVLVDGPVSDVITFNPKDKPRLPLYIAKLLDTSIRHNLTIQTTLEELHRQFSDKGITPSVSMLKKDGQLKVTGTALMDRSGKYKLTINADQTKLLKILQNEKKGEFPFTLTLPQQPNEGFYQENLISFFPNNIRVKTKTDYQEDRFKFDIGIKMNIVVTERLFPFDIKKEAPELEKQIQEEFVRDFQTLIKKIQEAQIDPIGLGLHARAYEYSHWKKVQDSWGEAFSKAEVNVKVKINLQSIGSIE